MCRYWGIEHLEKALHESERRFTHMLSNIELISMTLDRDAKVTFCNDYLLQLTGWQRDEVIGSDWFNRFIPAGDKNVRANFLNLLNDLPKAWHYENEILTRSGERRLVRWNNTVLRSTSGEVTGTASIGEDITNQRQAEIELTISKEKYQTIVENINEVIYEIDFDGIMTYISPAIQSIAGFSDSYYIGKSIQDVVYEKDLKNTIEKFDQIISSGVKNPIEFRIRTNFDELVWLRTSSNPIIIDKKITGIRGIAMDVTKHKISDETIRKLTRAIDQSPVSIIITNLEGEIEYVNSQTHLLTGYTKEELIGQNTRIFSSGERPVKEYENLWETIRSGKEWKGEFHNKKKTGELYWESVSISPILDEKSCISHYLAVKENITERKKLTSDLIEARIRAEASDKLKTAFLNNVSHEVRTPLNGILGFSELIIQPGILQKEKESYLKILNESSERLLNTITDFTDISLIVSGNMVVKFKPVDISLLLDRIYIKYHPKCIARNLEFIKQISSDLKIPLICNEELIEKALSHLLDNSLKFTIKGSIILGANFINREFELFVKDSGSGIGSEAKSIVFQIFMQEDSDSTRGYEGSGLGLSIAKGLVELMGGRIKMESEKGIGTTVYLNFP
jgi:hypothetical protein